MNEVIKKADVTYETEKMIVIDIELSNGDKIEAIAYNSRTDGHAHYLKANKLNNEVWI